MNLVYRSLTPDDLDDYIAIRREMLEKTPHHFASSPADDRSNDREAMRSILGGAPTNRVFAAFDGERLVGVTGALVEPKVKRRHALYVWGVYVAPTHRRRGIARRLLADVLSMARALPDVRQIDLGVSAEAPAARALYESLGFEAWGREPSALLVDGKLYDELHMQLVL